MRLWARSINESGPTLRFRSGGRAYLEQEAAYLARASGDEGVMSVWVETDSGEVTWAAGEKSREADYPPFKAE